LEHGDDLAEGPTPNQLKEFEDCSNSLLQELHDRIDNLLHGFAPADQQAVISILTRAGRFVVADGAMSTLHGSSLSGRQVARIQQLEQIFKLIEHAPAPASCRAM
jgi:hypothetical protein